MKIMKSAVLTQENVANFSLLEMTILLSCQQPYLSFTTAVQRAESAGAKRNTKPVDPMEMGEQHGRCR